MEKEDLSQLKISRSENEPVTYRRSNRKKIVWALLIFLLLGFIGLGYYPGLSASLPGSLGDYGFPGLSFSADYPP